MRLRECSGLQNGRGCGVREGETLSPGYPRSTCTRDMGTCERGARGEVTYGGWVGVTGRSASSLARGSHHHTHRGRSRSETRCRSSRAWIVTTPSPTLTEAPDGTHQEVGRRVGVRRREGRGVYGWDSREGTAPRGAGGAALERRHGAVAFGLGRASSETFGTMPYTLRHGVVCDDLHEPPLNDHPHLN